MILKGAIESTTWQRVSPVKDTCHQSTAVVSTISREECIVFPFYQFRLGDSVQCQAAHSWWVTGLMYLAGPFLWRLSPLVRSGDLLSGTALRHEICKELTVFSTKLLLTCVSMHMTVLLWETQTTTITDLVGYMASWFKSSARSRDMKEEGGGEKKGGMERGKEEPKSAWKGSQSHTLTDTDSKGCSQRGSVNSWKC